MPCWYGPSCCLPLLDVAMVFLRLSGAGVCAVEMILLSLFLVLLSIVHNVLHIGMVFLRLSGAGVCAVEMILLSNRQYLLVLPSCSHPYTGTPEQPLQNCQVGIVHEKMGGGKTWRQKLGETIQRSGRKTGRRGKLGDEKD